MSKYTSTIEIVEAVDNINGQLYDQLGPETTAVLTYTYSTYAQWIEWSGTQIWSSEDDMREWIEATSEPYPPPIRGFRIIDAHYEPMDRYLMGKINQIAEQIGKITLRWKSTKIGKD